MRTSGNFLLSILAKNKKTPYHFFWLLAGFLFLAFSSGAKTVPPVYKQVAVVSVDASGKVVLTPNMLMNTRQYREVENIDIKILDNSGKDYGRELSAINVGQKMIYQIVSDNDHVKYEGELVVVDAVPPVLKCTDHYITALADYSPRKIGYPVVFDNVTNIDNRDLMFEDTYYDLDCYSEMDGVAVTGMIERKWTAVDESDNKSVRTQTIYIRKQSLSEILFPEDIGGISSCKIDDIAETGVPQIDGKRLFNSEMSKLVVSHTDDVTRLEGNKKLILRKWKVVDICTDEQIEKVQMIRVEENELPAMKLPEHMTFSTNATDNYAVVILQRPDIAFGCVEPIVTVSWKFGEGFGPYENIPVGMYEVKYRIANRDGYQKEYSTVVVVEDNEKPSIIPKMQTEIYKEEGQPAVVFANTLNDGSFDNCGIDYFEVSLDGKVFGDSVEIPTESGKTDVAVGVTLRGYDVNGLFSDAKTTIIVHSK